MEFFFWIREMWLCRALKWCTLWGRTRLVSYLKPVYPVYPPCSVILTWMKLLGWKSLYHWFTISSWFAISYRRVSLLLFVFCFHKWRHVVEFCFLDFVCLFVCVFFVIFGRVGLANNWSQWMAARVATQTGDHGFRWATVMFDGQHCHFPRSRVCFQFVNFWSCF